MKLPRQCRSQTRLPTPVCLKQLQDAPLRHPASLTGCTLRPNTDRKFCHSSTVKFDCCAVRWAASRYRGMKLVAALVVSIALSGSAVAGNPRSELRSERRDTAASQRRVTCSSCERDGHGRIRRNAAARRAFQREHPCPSTGAKSGPCPGYVVDHLLPLKRGGADEPSNMQWQGTAEGKAKDRVE